MSEPGLFSRVSMATSSFSLVTSVSCIRSEHWFQFSDTHALPPLASSSFFPSLLISASSTEGGYIFTCVESFDAGYTMYLYYREIDLWTKRAAAEKGNCFLTWLYFQISSLTIYFFYFQRFYRRSDDFDKNKKYRPSFKFEILNEIERHKIFSINCKTIWN